MKVWILDLIKLDILSQGTEQEAGNDGLQFLKICLICIHSMQINQRFCYGVMVSNLHYQPQVKDSNQQIKGNTRLNQKVSPRKKSRYSSHAEKILQVESIEEEILEKHGETYSKEQVRAWAHLIQMGKHDSTADAPNKPFWKNRCAKKDSATNNNVISPVKRVQLQGQLVDQLLKWHSLLEKGGIGEEQYNENIMKSVKKL